MEIGLLKSFQKLLCFKKEQEKEKEQGKKKEQETNFYWETVAMLHLIFKSWQVELLEIPEVWYHSSAVGILS